MWYPRLRQLIIISIPHTHPSAPFWRYRDEGCIIPPLYHPVIGVLAADHNYSPQVLKLKVSSLTLCMKNSVMDGDVESLVSVARLLRKHLSVLKQVIQVELSKIKFACVVRDVSGYSNTGDRLPCRMKTVP